MTKRLYVNTETTPVGNDYNDVKLNGVGALRVRIKDGTVWERKKPEHLWGFEETLGDDFTDSINNYVIEDDFTFSRVPSFTTTLSQAIQVLPADFNTLTSKPFPFLVTEGLGLQPSAEKMQLSIFGGKPIEGATLAPSFTLSDLREVVKIYDSGNPEGTNLAPAFTLSNLREVVVTYNNGAPEGTNLVPAFTLSNLRVVVVEYNNGAPEGTSLVPAFTLSNLETV